MRPLRELRVVTPDTQVSDAVKLAANGGPGPLPVVEDGRLLGIVFRSQLPEHATGPVRIENPEHLPEAALRHQQGC